MRGIRRPEMNFRTTGGPLTLSTSPESVEAGLRRIPELTGCHLSKGFLRRRSVDDLEAPRPLPNPPLGAKLPRRALYLALGSTVMILPEAEKYSWLTR